MIQNKLSFHQTSVSLEIIGLPDYSNNENKDQISIIFQDNFKKSIGFDIQNTSIVNFLSSFLLGILVALNFINNEILVLFYSGFLGCFSTFSSFIYQLFILFKKRKFLRLFFHYIEVIIFSFLFFYLGYFLVQFF